jgi:F-type H+-transporting ATPase subunit b
MAGMLAALLIVFCSVCVAQQQSAPPPATGTTPATTTPGQGSQLKAEFPSQTASSGQELSHASNEAAGEDETTAFKQSPTVKWIARITGLSVTTTYWLCVVLNFAVIAVAVVFFMRSSLPAAFRARTQSIQKDMEDARHASADAQQKLKAIEDRLARMNVEIGEMQARAESDSHAEEERVRASIEEEKKRIVQSAEQEVQQATSAARRDLQKYAVALAIEMAEKGIRVDANEDKALVEDFTSQLAAEKRRNGGS